MSSLCKTLLTATALTVAFAVPSAQAGPTFFYSIAAISSSTAGSDLFAASGLIEGPGVGFNANAPYTQITGSSTNLWVTDRNCFPCNYFATHSAPPILTLNLGQDQQLSAIFVGNYAGHPNGARNFSLRFASAADGLSGFGTSITYNPGFSLAQQGTTMQEFDFSQSIVAQYVQMTITSNYYNPGNPGAGGDRVGLGEIAFVPEPASLALLGIGLAGVGFSRRKKVMRAA